MKKKLKSHTEEFPPVTLFPVFVGTERMSTGTPTATSERKMSAILFWVNQAEQARVIQRRAMENTLARRGIPLPSRRTDPGGSTPELSGRIGISDQDHPDQPAVANGCDLSAGQELGLVLSDLGPG